MGFGAVAHCQGGVELTQQQGDDGELRPTPQTRRRAVGGTVGSQNRLYAVQTRPEQRPQRRQHGVAVNDDGVRAEAAERAADARVVDRTEADLLDRRSFRKKFVVVAIGQVGRPGHLHLHLGIERFVEREARGEKHLQFEPGRARERAIKRHIILDRMRDDDRDAARPAQAPAPMHASSIFALRSMAPLSRNHRRATSAAPRRYSACRSGGCAAKASMASTQRSGSASARSKPAFASARPRQGV